MLKEIIGFASPVEWMGEEALTEDTLLLELAEE
jgi:hypothetical protein